MSYDENNIWEDDALELGDIWTEITGRVVEAGASEDEIWISSNRTNGKEYFDDIAEAERRLKILYSDLLIDDGEEYDPLEGF